MKKKILLFTIIASIVGGMSNITPTFAITSNTTNTIKIVEEIEFKEFPQMNIADLSKDFSLKNNSNVRFHGKLTENNKLGEINNKTKIESRGITQSWTGTLQNQGDITYIIASLAPNQILNASLKCPNNENLNYDLLVHEVDENGYLGDLVAASTTGTYFNSYPDGTKKTVDEGAAFINKTNQIRDYAIIVSATEGGSSIDSFELTVSLDVPGTYDAAEPNDSAYDAYSVTEGTVTGANLHVSNDQDWYMWKATSEFKEADINATAGYEVEVYNAIGNKLALIKPDTNGIYKVQPGVNYIRVFEKDGNFIPSRYSLNIIPTKLTPAKMTIELNGDMGNDLIPYPEGKYLRYKNEVNSKIQLASESGYVVSGYPLELYWESESWSEQSGNKMRTVSGVTDKKGEVILSLSSPKLPPAIGGRIHFIPGPMSITHYYDISYLKVSGEGVNSYVTPAYHFSRSEY
ncbi:MAG: hypothetical protein ACRDD2_09725 [Sarcina sp.]